MSHYTVIETQIASADHLVRALGDMGFRDVEIHREPQPLVGWLGDSRKTVANLIIRKRFIGPASNDIGFVQTPSGYFKAQISDFDRFRFGEGWLRHLSQRYAYHVATDMLDQQEFETVEEARDRDGTIRITARRMP